MGTELGGGGLVTPASLKVAEDGMRRVLAHIGLLQGPVPAPSPTRLTEIGGDDYYVYASDGGLFEPLVDLGAEIKAGQPAARIHFHHTPWREPDRLTFKRDGWCCASACRRAASAATASSTWRRISEDSKSCDGAGAGYPSFARGPS